MKKVRMWEDRAPNTIGGHKNSAEQEEMMKRNLSMEPSEGGSRTGSWSAKKLRFSDRSKLIVAASKSREDVEESWYTKAEIDQFKSNVQRAIKALGGTRTAAAMQHIAHSVATGSEQPRIRLNYKEVVRGIEHMISPEALEYILHKRATHMRRVLEEQHAQKRAGTTHMPISAARMRAVSEVHSSFASRFFGRIIDLQRAPEKGHVHSS
ncbi:hypothetical protein ACHAXT_000314 [Thalassiosira profunda]